MPDRTNLTDAIANLSELCDRVVEDRDVIIITRPDGENVALIAADELESLMETVHLLLNSSFYNEKEKRRNSN